MIIPVREVGFVCGILGYVENEARGCKEIADSAKILHEGLRRLTYRGYDSWGFAFLTENGIQIIKEVGDVEKVPALQPIGSGIAICHCRWATHGGVTRENAHPHISCDGGIAVVHNGIIENYQELKKMLQSNGHFFRSETDTEVITHLIEDFCNSGLDFQEAVRKSSLMLEGSFSFAVMSKDFEGIIGVKNGSPLIVGLGKDGNFISSDILAFYERADKAIYIEDGDMVVIKRGKGNSPIIKRIESGERVFRKDSDMRITYGNASKGGHEYYMIKEIMEQPQCIRNALNQDISNVRKISLEILRYRNVVITACGSSRYAALVGRYLFSKLAGKFCDVVMASEFHYFSDSIDKNTLVIAVSQSGETADVIEGVRKARENGAKILSIVNVVDSTLARMSDYVIYTNCGPEIGVAATKSFSGQLVIFYLLAFAMADRQEEAETKIKKIAETIESALEESSEKIRDIAEKTSKQKDFYYIGRGINFAIASEGALKMKEISYVHAEGMPAGELKHGTIALVEKGTPVIAICPKDYTFHETLNNAIETKARGARVIGISNEKNAAFDDWVKLPEVEDIFYPLVTVMPLQLFAYYSAVARGRNPDKPRNLAKSVTVK